MKRYFITGLLIWAPLGITIWVLSFILGMMDQSVMLLPTEWHPRSMFGFNIPGLGALLTLLVVFLTGLLTANFIGQRPASPHSCRTLRLPERQANFGHDLFAFRPSLPPGIAGAIPAPR